MIGRIGDEAEGQLLAWSKLGMQLHCGIEMETSPARAVERPKLTSVLVMMAGVRVVVVFIGWLE